MKHALLGLMAAAMLASPAFAAKLICKDTGKEVTSSCCCSVKDGKFVCEFTKKTHNTCCCESKSS
jgi:hypothetical protein